MAGWKSILALAALCVAGALAQVKTGAKQQAAPPTAPPDSGQPCTCKGVIRRSLDCSSRQRSSFGSADLCTGRTTKVNLSHNNFVTFPSSWGSYITDVNIAYNQLSSIPRSPPLNPGTTKLDLSENRIEHATDELRALAELEKLYVGGNRLRTLSFLPSPCALQKLNASRNLLTAIDGAIARCTELEDLDLSHNQILSLPRVTLAGLAKLDELVLKDAGLVTIEEGAFRDLVKLELLDLSENDLTSLPAGLFTTLHELDDLFLDHNSITSLPADAFVGLDELERLTITNNKLTTLAQGAFSGLQDLKILSLKHNRLTTLPSNVFSNLPEIKAIDVSYNQLDSLPAHLFTGLGTLKKINMENNRLSALPADLLSGVSSLEVIDLSNNQLSALPSGLFRDVASVQVLDLSNNRFTAFSGRDLVGLQELEHINLEFNLLTSLPLYDASWPRVGKAVFGHNNIVTAGEVTLRSWLGDGSQKRVVSIEGRPPLTSPGGLRWAVTDGQITTETSKDMGCSCGTIKKGEAEVKLCVAAACPDVHPSWVEAVRAAPAPVTGVKG